MQFLYINSEDSETTRLHKKLLEIEQQEMTVVETSEEIMLCWGHITKQLLGSLT